MNFLFKRRAFIKPTHDRNKWPKEEPQDAFFSLCNVDLLLMGGTLEILEMLSWILQD